MRPTCYNLLIGVTVNERYISACHISWWLNVSHISLVPPYHEKSPGVERGDF